MNHARLDAMTKGWFVGAFQPTALHSDACEVAVRSYRAGDRDAAHFHKVASEVTVLLSGRMRMAGREWAPGDIVVLSPGDVSDFEALTDLTIVVVKVPGALNDKYMAEPAAAPAA